MSLLFVEYTMSYFGPSRECKKAQPPTAPSNWRMGHGLEELGPNEAQAETEFGENVYEELLRQSVLNFKTVDRVSPCAKRRHLAGYILYNAFHYPDTSTNKYLLAITLLDRFLYLPQGETRGIPEDTESSLALVVALARLAAKYEGDYGPYGWADKIYTTETQGSGDSRNKAEHGQGMDGAEPEVKRREVEDKRERLNEAERMVLRGLDYDLHWPTPLHFVRILLRNRTEAESLTSAIETILVIASIGDCFAKFPAHIVAAASYLVSCRLLRVAKPVSTAL